MSRSVARAARGALVLMPVIGVVATAASPSSREDPADSRRTGLELAAAGQCEAALPLLARAHATAGFDSRAAVAEAQCQMRLHRYAKARELLEALRTRYPDLPELNLYLAIASYRSGDRSTAKRLLASVRDQLPARVEAHLYRGIISLEEGENEAAAAAFDAARGVDAARAEPLASYYAGVARARLGSLEGAREDAERVLAQQDEGVWADRARRLIGRIDERLRPLSWLASASVGYEYDSNVILRGDDVSLPDDVSDEADERLTWSLRGSSELVRSQLGTIGSTLDYVGTRYDELRAFDVEYPTVSFWWRRGLGSSTLVRAEYRFGYAWVDYHPFVDTHSLNLSFLRAFTDNNRTRMDARAYAYRYRDEPTDLPDGNGTAGSPCPDETPGVPFRICGSPGVDEGERLARSGIGYALAVGHTFSTPATGDGLEIEADFSFRQYFADGRESDYLQLSPSLGARIRLPWDLSAEAIASYAYRPFRSRSSLPDPRDLQTGVQFAPTRDRRRDHVVRTSISLERQLWDHLSLEARYNYVDNNSNQATANYQRHVVGAYATVQIGD